MTRGKLKLGHAFSDSITKVQSGKFKVQSEGEWRDGLIPNYSDNFSSQLTDSWRRVVLLGLFLFTLAGLFMRLFNLQIVEGKQWRDLADSNRIKVKVIHAPRGVIYDRNGKILAQNDPGFRLVEKDASGSAHSRLVSRDEALKMEVDKDPRFNELEIDSIRTYPYGEATAHVLGYMGEITDIELKDPKYSDYKLGDLVGRGGVEQTYEKYLKGTDGGEIIEVDSEGNAIRTLRKTDPIPGQNIYLSIDADLQKVAYQKLTDQIKKVGSCCGALVAEDPRNGQILALASYPSFDPKNLSPALLNPNAPLLDRAIGGEYPPGSTFKIASSLAALSSGKITSTQQFDDTGVMSLGPYTFANWYFTQYGKKEGPVDLLKAIQRSNDIYFYNVGNIVGETYLGDTAKKLGLGTILGIDLPGEASGLIPTDAWKDQNVGQPWYPGDTLHMAIGQGYVLATPLQILNMTSEVAEGGKEYPPHLGLKITSPDNFPLKQFKFDPFNLPFKSSDIALVQQGLREVPQFGGTAWPFFPFNIPTAGKTGTAEFGDPKDRTHAWYTSYAPATNPTIALTVLVEAGGEGSNTSAPIAKDIYTWYFSKDKNKLSNFDTLTQVSSASAKTLGE